MFKDLHHKICAGVGLSRQPQSSDLGEELQELTA